MRPNNVVQLGSSSALGAGGLVKRRAQCAGELERVIMRPEMHKNQAWLLAQHMTVNRGHLDTVGAQHPEYLLHFLCRQHEVAGDGGVTTASRLEVDSGRDSHRTCWGDLHPTLTDWIAPRHIELVDTTIRLSLGP